jgi:alpha-tubulin suppressor-like RCC1 family protein
LRLGRHRAGSAPAACRTARRLLALLAGTLLAAALLSGSAWGRLPAGAQPAVNEDKAPKVTHNPANLTVEEGQSATFEATASGVPAPTVQWEVSTNGGSTFSPIAEATSDQLTIASARTSESGDEFRAVFTNVAGQASTKAATLTVQLKPVVTHEPASVTVEEGRSATFEATASAFPAATVQWESSSDGGSTWRGISHATSNQLTVADVTSSESGDEFRATFKNVAGQTASEAATLTVQRLPAVTKQPLSVTVEEGREAMFEATASGFPAPTVQWELSTDGGSTFAPVPGASADRLTIASAQSAETGDDYRAVFTNAAGSVTTHTVTLTVQDPPLVTKQPTNTTVEVGQSATFEAAASGFPAPAVQWELSTNGGSTFTAVAGATADQLTIEEAKTSENGDEYRATFSNVAGTARTAFATLTVAIHHFRALAWGQNSFGQLGDESFSMSSVPVPVTGLNFVTAVAAGRRHSLALLSDSTVVAWGDGASGQLGNGEGRSSDVPVAVEGLTGVKAIAAGANFSLALLDNGTVMTWGAGEAGQLGNGANQESDVPVPVKGLSGVTAIAAGGEHALALLGNGTVMAWGEGEHGQLGNGASRNSDVPVVVKGLSGVAAIAAGQEHSLALLKAGTVTAWGSDWYGQLGDKALREANEGEEEPSSDVPVAVEGLSGVSAISAGAHHNLALLSAGTVMAWGEDESGELGDGSIVEREETPVAVSGLTGVTAVSAGGEHSMALLSAGTVMTWGEDKFGELGDGSAGEPSDVPVAVTGLGQVAGIAAGGDHDLAYSEPLPGVTAVNPAAGAEAGGTIVTITGTNLEGATAVHFGASSAKSFEVTSPSSIVAVAPAGSLGTVNVTVTTPAGTSPPVVADRFSYVPPPVLRTLSTTSGPGGGETTVTITGSEFVGVTAVDFGASPASSFEVTSPTSIIAVSPAGAGTVNVTVSAAGGTSAISKHDQFGYIPVVEGVAPNSGPIGGATRVTITGEGFAVGAGATSFKFGKKAATDVACSSSTTCTATTPASKTAGTVDVVAAVGKLKSAANPPDDQFTYE